MIRDASSMDRPVDRARGLQGRLKLWVPLAIVAIGLAAVLYPSVRRWAQSEMSIDISRIRVAVVRRGDLIRDVSVEGRIVAGFHPTLFSSAPGIAHLVVDAGEVVQQGQELARVVSPELESRFHQESSRLLSARADLERQRILSEQTRLANEQSVGLLEVELEAAHRAMDRAQRSRDEGILNAVEYETAQDDVRVADLKLDVARKQARFESDSLEFEVQNRQSQVQGQKLLADDLSRQVDELVLRAPVSGLVSRLHIEDQDAVGQSQAVVTVVDLSAFEVEIFVPESYADEVIPPTKAVIRYEGEEFEGEVKSISPEVEGSRVRGIVAFTDGLPAGLKQNQRVSTRLVLETKNDVLKVERGPFVENGGGRLAYVIDNGMAVLRPIEVGSLSVSEVQIRSGLQLGDQIIISDTARFEGAEKVLIRR